MWWCIVLSVMWVSALQASDTPRSERYAASRIPVSLLRDVDAVVRMDSTVFVVDGTHTVMHVLHAVTIVAPAGRGFGTLSLAYDEFRAIESLDGDLYDAEGAHVRSLEDGDVDDYAAIASHSLYEDSRVRTAALFHGSYPYTVVFSYEISDDAAIGWPDWEPEYKRASVERSTFEVRLSGPDTLRWWSNAALLPHVRSLDGRTHYRWEAAGLEPIEPERNGPPEADQYARVKIAPHLFEVDGHAGDLSTWRSFGMWFDGLSADRQELSPLMRATIASLTDGVTDVRERVRRLYTLLQTRTRYVNVTLGIGGWQPFPASYVEERGYGDCKALTNFMRSMLRAAGIRSFPALIYAGPQPRWLVHSFPHNCFNHVILCVPMAGDTVWLECTSPSAPFAHLGASTENRYALVVTPDGGVLCRTPQSTPASNAQSRKAMVTMTPEGDGTASIVTRYTGNQMDRVRGALRDATPQERETWLREDITIPAATLRQSDFSSVTRHDPHVDLSFRVDLRRYGAPTGSRLLFTPNLMERRTYVPPADSMRKQPIMVTYPYLDIDTVVYTLPVGYAIEALPPPVHIETPFARYSTRTIVSEAHDVVFLRRLEVTATELPASDYARYRSFWIDVVKADNAAAALVRK